MKYQFIGGTAIVDTIQFTGENIDDINTFIGDNDFIINPTDWVVKREDGKFRIIDNTTFLSTYEPQV